LKLLWLVAKTRAMSGKGVVVVGEAFQHFLGGV
jgi:hypothetical protein